jgi:Tol biopolymer transport system component/DNA-binding winged helix-turn-helix (wHTH) protein
MATAGSSRFGPFRLDADSRTLTRDGAPVPLAPRTLDLLLVFAGSGGRLLTKNELLRVVWGDVNVEEASLAFQVSALRKALGEFGPAWIETVPKHGYRFTALVERTAAAPPAELAPRADAAVPPGPAADAAPPGAAPAGAVRGPGARTWGAVALAAAVLAVAAAVTLSMRSAPGPAGDPQFTAVLLTTYPGVESHPSLSPDGSHVAFSWGGEPQKDPDIYVQLAGHGRPSPLTSNPRAEYSPAWSPDGRLIAFCRQTGAVSERADSGEIGSEIVVVPAQGGAERVVASPGSAWVPVCDTRVPTLSWFPGSDALASLGRPPAGVAGAAAAIYYVPIHGGDAQRLTFPAPASWGDAMPAVSPDGRYLAFARSNTQFWVSSRVLLLRLNAHEPAGEPALLLPSIPADADSAPDLLVAGLGWSPDSRHVLFTRGGLRMVPLAGPRTPARIPTPGPQPGVFSVSRDGSRLAFSSGSMDLDIWRMPGPSAAGGSRGDPAGGPFIATTQGETNPQYSADGKRIVFTSTRSGGLQIWVADADGLNPVQVTNTKAWNGTPRWSPDGRYIAYDAVAGPGAKGDILVIPSGGGPARRVTPEDSHEHVPSWSRDGRWIYFESDRTGEYQLWKTEFPAGRTEQVTFDGGSASFESADGRWLYYGKHGRTGLWRRPISGGDEEQVAERGHSRFWGVYDRGLCVMDPLSRDVVVECQDAESSRWVEIARFPNEGRVRPTGPSFAVSPDGQWILYSRVEREQQDITLLDGFGSAFRR